MWGASPEHAETNLPEWGDPKFEVFFSVSAAGSGGSASTSWRTRRTATDLETSGWPRRKGGHRPQGPGTGRAETETKGISVPPHCLGRKCHSCSGSLPGADSDDGEVAQVRLGASRLEFAAAWPGWINEV